MGFHHFCTITATKRGSAQLLARAKRREKRREGRRVLERAIRKSLIAGLKRGEGD